MKADIKSILIPNNDEIHIETMHAFNKIIENENIQFIPEYYNLLLSISCVNAYCRDNKAMGEKFQKEYFKFFNKYYII